MKKILFFFVVLLTSVQMMAQDVTDGRTYFSFLEENQYEETATFIHTETQFDHFIHSDCPVVAMFKANWCGPCKVMLPIFTSLPTKYPSFAFIVVDVDELESIAESQSIRTLPTFFLYKGGQKVDCVVGANELALNNMIWKYNE